MVFRSRALTQLDRCVSRPAPCRRLGDEFAIARRSRIAGQCGLAALTRPCNHNNPHVLEHTEHQFGGKAGKERVIGIFPTGWKLRLLGIKIAFCFGSLTRLIQNRTWEVPGLSARGGAAPAWV